MSATNVSQPSQHWTPGTALGGTELMLGGLRQRLGAELERIDLRLNSAKHAPPDGKRPLVVWIHHDIVQPAAQWCQEASVVANVDWFVFVSYWQRQRFIEKFNLRPERCVVLRNATEVDSAIRRWEPGPVLRFAHTIVPYRGLSVLLDAWELLSLPSAELHVWSSMKLYAMSDNNYEHLFERARSMPGVVYHGLAPNAELRAALREMHFLVYPALVQETSCIALMEAMAAGCRVIIPALGALPETTCGFARIYPYDPNWAQHAKICAEVMAEEAARPWNGRAHLSELSQAHAAAIYDWEHRAEEWRQFIDFCCSRHKPN